MISFRIERDETTLQLRGWKCERDSVNYQQQPLVPAESASGGFCLKMFFFTPLDPSARRLGVSKICTILIIIPTSHIQYENSSNLNTVN